MEKECREQLIEKLKQVSAQDTCWPGCADGWKPENPAWGHCVMYTLYVQEFFGGDIVFTEAVLPGETVVPHYLNRFNGEEFDFSGSQFKEGTVLRAKKIVTRAYVLSLPDREAERYQMFRDRVLRLAS